ncbi:MAG: LamG domain-containing protein, partial [Planctomycetia bacterium]|nr:LamG domain-containing protein [Planctomycetia bacterium]
TVMKSDGTIAELEEDGRVKLTAEIRYGDIVLSETYRITVRGKASLICGYDFETAGEDGTIPALEGSELAEPAVLTGTASVVTDETRGNVLLVENEEGAKNVNYLALPEDTLQPVSSSGYTVAMWVNIGAETFEHSALFEADADNNYPLTRIGANLIARINANNYSDVQGALLTTNGERDVWQHVVYTVDPYGIKVYLNGALVGEEEKNIEDCFKKNKTGISMAKHVMVGSGAIWNDEDCRRAMFDDVMIYSGVLTEKDVKALYADE